MESTNKKHLILLRAITYVLLCSLAILANTTYASNKDSERIEGVAKFLADRANDNFLYIFEHSIKENKEFKCYFSNTYKNLEIAGLKELLYSRKLWNKSLNDDLDILLTRSAARYIEKTLNMRRVASKTASLYIDLLNTIEIKYKDRYRSITSLPIDADKELRRLTNEFYNPANKLIDKINFFSKFDTKLCQTPVVNHKDLKDRINTLSNIDAPFKEIKELIKKHRKNKTIRFPASEAIYLDISSNVKKNLKNLETEINKVTNEVKKLQELIDTFNDPEESNTVKSISAIKAIQDHASMSDEEINRIKKHILFFAQLSDAETKEDAAAIMKAYTVPSVSFFEKRGTESRWSVNSYVGITTGESNVPSGEDHGNKSGIYAPIGIEFSTPCNDGGSCSLMVAPFDFGYPVSLKLNGIDKNVNFDEIVAPSIALSYGLEKYPVAIGFAYQKGRTFPGSNDTEEHIFLHISFDMPLYFLN